MHEEIKNLLEEIKGAVDLSPEEQAMLQVTIEDTAQLTARMLAGEDVQGELAIVQATALNLAYAKKAIVQNHVEAFFSKLISVAIAAAFA